MRAYLIPVWGTMPLREITRTPVHELLDTLVAQGMTAGVNRIQALISRLFTLALDRSLVNAHPAARMMKRFQERPSDRVLTDDELRALVAGLDARPGRAADALRLRLLLGQRGEEIIGMTWGEIDLKAKLWDLPGARTKNRRLHSVPLSASAMSILKRRRSEISSDEPRVFPDLTPWTDDYRALAEIAGGAMSGKIFAGPSRHDSRRSDSTKRQSAEF
jgi:integrase